MPLRPARAAPIQRGGARRRSPRRGFTLLEVMISLGILAIAMLAIADLNGGAVRNHAYAKRLTVAVQLSRSKMLDLQQQLRKDGLSDFSKEYHGDFDEEKEPDYKWSAEVVKPEIDVDPAQVMSMITSGLGMGAPEGGGPSQPENANPLAALGPMGGLVDQQVKGMVETLKSSVREVRLRVTWKQGAQDEELVVVEHLIILPNSAAAAAAAGTAMQPGAGGAGAPAVDPAELMKKLGNGGLPR